MQAILWNRIVFLHLAQLHLLACLLTAFSAGPEAACVDLRRVEDKERTTDTNICRVASIALHPLLASILPVSLYLH